MNLREMRERAGLTQDQVSAKSDLDQTTISQLESGKVRDPRYSTLQALAVVYGVTPDDIVQALGRTVAEAA